MQSTTTVKRLRESHALIFVALLATVGCTPPVQNETSPGFGNDTVAGPSANADGTVPYKVIDTKGFDRPMTAYTIDIPAGWTAAAQIRWDNRNGQCTFSVASPNIRLTSPDGTAQIEILPGFLISNYGDVFANRGSRPGDYCVVTMADTGEKLVRDVALPRLRRGWTVDAMTSVALPPNVKSLADMARSGGDGSRVEPYSVETVLRSPDGNAYEKLTMSGVAVTSPQIIQGVPPQMLNQNIQTIAVRGPRNQLDRLEAMALAVLASSKSDPEWQREMNAFREGLARASRPRPPRSGSTSSGGSSSSGNPGFDMDGWKEGERREGVAQGKRIDVIREEEDCRDPETGRVYKVSIHVGCPS